MLPVEIFGKILPKARGGNAAGARVNFIPLSKVFIQEFAIERGTRLVGSFIFPFDDVIREKLDEMIVSSTFCSNIS